MNNRVLIFGALIGAATGLVAALMLQRRAERTGTEISLSAGEGIQLGVMVMGLLRAVASLADKEDNS
jgi:gas vesicle protein